MNVKRLADTKDVNAPRSNRCEEEPACVSRYEQIPNNDYAHNDIRSSFLYASIAADGEAQKQYEVQHNEYVNHQDLVDGRVVYSHLAAAVDIDDDDANAAAHSNVYYNV